MTWTVTRVADVPKNGPHWRPVRLHLGIEAFGLNSSHGNTGDLLVLEHDESLSGHEELYVVLAGHARFEVNGDPIDAPEGTLVMVSDPGARRRAVALADDTEILTVGATPGEPFAHSAWEYGYIVSGLYDEGLYERALDRARGFLQAYPSDWPVLYSAACSAAKLGLVDEALEYLRRASELEPTIAAKARDHDVFDPYRDQVESVLSRAG
jgi:tetratricopeptide (TPR) repeat protein